MTVHAKPNLNGDSPETFKANARRVYGAASSLMDALQQARAECLHGRNYQHLSPTAGDNLMPERDLDLLRLDHLLTAVIMAEQLAVDLNLAAHDAVA